VRREESTNRRKGPILQFLEIPGKIQKPDHLNPKSTFMGERGLGGEGRGGALDLSALYIRFAAMENATKHKHLNREQETQLSLTNRATRLEVNRGHQTWYHSI